MDPLLVLIGAAPLIATNTQRLTAQNELNRAQWRSLVPLAHTPKHLLCSGPVAGQMVDVLFLRLHLIKALVMRDVPLHPPSSLKDLPVILQGDILEGL